MIKKATHLSRFFYINFKITYFAILIVKGTSTVFS